MSADPLRLRLLDDLSEVIANRAAEIVLERQQNAPAAQWLTTESAARYLDCDKRRIYKLRSSGRLTAYHEGGRLLFRRQDCDRIIEEGGASGA